MSPNLLPTFVPITDKINVITPISVIAKIKLTLKNANVIPTANASILVAIASIIIVLKLTSSFIFSLSLLNDSFIMFPPIIASKKNAIQ